MTRHHRSARSRASGPDERVIRLPSETVTVSCTLLFADIARYSLLPDPDQRLIIEKLHRVMRDTTPGSYLVDAQKGFFVATGDGMLLAFRDNAARPDQVVEFALTLQRNLGNELRIGLSRGECEVYADFNSVHFYQHRGVVNNIAGTAVNMTQRVMSLGDPGDILATAEFVEHCRIRGYANYPFRDLGTVLVKHGLPLRVWQHLPVPSAQREPKRIRAYATAQRTVYGTLKNIHLRIMESNPGKRVRDHGLRVAFLRYDHDSKEIKPTVLRVGHGIDPERPPAPSNTTFTLDEGPGQAVRNKRAFYIELSNPAESRIRWQDDYSRQAGVPPHKSLLLQRPAQSYLYLPLFHGIGTDEEVYGVLSIAAMTSLFSRAAIATTLVRNKQLPPRRLAVLVDRVIEERIREVTELIRDMTRELGDAWALLNQY